MSKQPLRDFLKFFYSFIMMIISFIFVLPGFVMNGPIALLLNILGERERKKVKQNYLF